MMKIFYFLLWLCVFWKRVPTGHVRVKIYDHRAEHDDNKLWGTGPYKYKGYGYGLEYQYNEDGTYQRERGYGFLKMFGRDFCNDHNNCRPSDSKFFDQVKHFKSAEPYWAHPPADVVQENDKHLNSNPPELDPQPNQLNS
ncbi:uncharacterized protein LOC141856992 [Brevipalpus obovatus]|uniref:uncharacterized protein LOC141856992 n=1 Tax=Brevipalpus obovatus TaxID=246614 RepID=UPI003D9DDD34